MMTKPKKPMIRHCYNCEWVLRFMGVDRCDVLYEYIHEPKKKAKCCMYFTMKESEVQNG